VIQPSAFTAKGDLLSASAAATPTTLPVGTNGQTLFACSTATNGICWGALPAATPTVAGIVLGCTISNNTALGCNALVARTTGNNNTAIGPNALTSNTSGCCNTAIGTNALFSNTTGRFNTATGTNALPNNLIGCRNSAHGLQALFTNTNGNNNTATGFSALCFNTTGSFNTAIGTEALFCNTTGSGNVMIGGVDALGLYSPVFNPTVENDRVMIGSTATTNAYVQVAWTVTSDARDKTNVTALPIGLEFVNKLNPVSFQFKESREDATPHGSIHYGFLAQEVLEVEGENPVIVDTEDPEKLKITNDHLNAVFVKAIQELSEQNKALEARIAQIESNG
jgi:hypothetical protein